MTNNKSLETIVEGAVKKVFQEKLPQKQIKKTVQAVVEKAKTLVETVILMPKVWVLKTEYLSGKTKEAHYQLYKDHLDLTNKISIKLDAVNKEPSNADHSAFRSLKLDEIDNKNSTILHELYFGNISSLNSVLHADTLTMMRLSRDFGTFDNWQFDFIATCLSSKEGWAICYLDTYKNKYMNCVVDGNMTGLPVGAIPIIVMDMHSHSYYKDYLSDKRTYITNLMKELNFDVIEGRIIVAERAKLNDLYKIMPVQHIESGKMVQNIAQNPSSIVQDKIIANTNGSPQLKLGY